MDKNDSGRCGVHDCWVHCLENYKNSTTKAMQPKLPYLCLSNFTTFTYQFSSKRGSQKAIKMKSTIELEIKRKVCVHYPIKHRMSNGVP